MMFLTDIQQFYIVPENAIFVDHGFKHPPPVSLVPRLSLPSVRADGGTVLPLSQASLWPPPRSPGFFSCSYLVASEGFASPFLVHGLAGPSVMPRHAERWPQTPWVALAVAAAARSSCGLCDGDGQFQLLLPFLLVSSY